MLHQKGIVVAFIYLEQARYIKVELQWLKEWVPI